MSDMAIENRAQPFGRLAKEASSPRQLVELEHQYDKAARFHDIDALVGSVLHRVLHSEQIAELIIDRVQKKLSPLGLSQSQQKVLDTVYSASVQQSYGAWYLPDEVSLRVGICQLPSYFYKYPRFAMNIVQQERAKLPLANNSFSMLVWTILEPLFSTLFRPFELRGSRVGMDSKEEQLKQWSELDQFLASLGFSVAKELAPMRYGGGWHRLRAPQQLEVKQHLLSALAEQVGPTMSTLYRAYRIQELLVQYYKKAKKGRVLRKQVLTKTLERTLSGFFAGDWIAALQYLEEEPHSDEQIATAIPTPRLYATGSDRAAASAKQLGIPLEEAEKIVAAFWGNAAGRTPIEQRISVLNKYWQLFDEIHSRQKTGMKSLWGLVEDELPHSLVDDDQTEGPFHPKLYADLLPAGLIRDIEQLWGTTMLPRWPDVIVTQPYPHFAMADTLGPALRFWHGCALTAWFVIQGHSRTDMPGLRQYYIKELNALEKIGAPVDSHLFEELTKADERLGPGNPVDDEKRSIISKLGITITLSIGFGTKRTGFEVLRDIVTRHRRTWTYRYFEQYLHVQWEHELRQAHREYNIQLQDRGKIPTVKQFAKLAANPANHWFGGDISALYTAIGEKSPVTPQRRKLMPDDIPTFCDAVQHALQELVTQSGLEIPQPPALHNFKRMAEMCIGYIQLEEALGSPPRRQEFSLNDYYWPLLGRNLDEAISVYGKAIEMAKQKLMGK
jgi:hypothetical protein